MFIHTIVSAPFQENTYILWKEGNSNAVVIDPGLDPEAIFSFLESKKLVAEVILNTHGHADHIAGNEALKAAFPKAPLIIGVNDAPLLTDAFANLSMMFGTEIISPNADRLVHEGDEIEAAGIRFLVRDVPGHSPGHVVFIVEGEPPVVFGGDVLMRGSIGRTDFPGGSFEQLAEGIRSKLYTMPDATVVYSGHGPTTTLGVEKRSNPFVRGE